MKRLLTIIAAVTLLASSVLITKKTKNMEDSKNNLGSFFQLPWVKALIAFIVFLLIFLAGAAFGSHFGGHRYAGQNGFMRFQTTTSRGGNVMFRGTGRAMPANGSINIQSQGTHRMGQ